MHINYNWQAVAVSTIVGLVLYGIWFTPYVCGGLWQRLEQLSDEGVRASLLPRLAVALIVSAAQSLCLGGFLNFTQSSSFAMGVLLALQLSLGLVVPALALFLLMGRRPIALMGVYLGWLLLSQMVAGGLLATWR